MQEKFIPSNLPLFDVTADPLKLMKNSFLNGALLCTIENIVKGFDRLYERTIDFGYEVRYINQRSKKSIKIVIVDHCNCRNTCIVLHI